MQVTEFNDFVEALHDALPEELQHGASIREKYQDVYNNWRELDMEMAIENVVINAIEDALVGGYNMLKSQGLRIAPSARQMTEWEQKSLKGDGSVEKEIAKWVSENIEPYIRDAIKSSDVKAGQAWDSVYGDWL